MKLNFVLFKVFVKNLLFLLFLGQVLKAPEAKKSWVKNTIHKLYFQFFSKFLTLRNLRKKISEKCGFWAPLACGGEMGPRKNGRKFFFQYTYVNSNDIFIENLLEISSIIDNIVWKQIFDI